MITTRDLFQGEPDTCAIDLSGFTGSETIYRHPLARSVHYSEGVQYLAEKAGAYWLVDEIALAQSRRPVRAEEFQVWRLTVTGNRATLTCDDGNDQIVYTKEISFTDFPMEHITLWCEGGVILLPSEH